MPQGYTHFVAVVQCDKTFRTKRLDLSPCCCTSSSDCTNQLVVNIHTHTHKHQSVATRLTIRTICQSNDARVRDFCLVHKSNGKYVVKISFGREWSSWGQSFGLTRKSKGRSTTPTPSSRVLLCDRFRLTESGLAEPIDLCATRGLIGLRLVCFFMRKSP